MPVHVDADENFPLRDAAHGFVGRRRRFFTRYDTQFWFGTFRQSLPVGDQTAEYQPLALLPDTRKITTQLNAGGTAQTFWRFSSRGHAKSNGRQALAAVAAAVGQSGLAALARITVKKSVLAFAADL